MRINATSGKVGIGTTQPGGKLTVVPDANGKGVEVLSPSAGNTHFPGTNNWNYISGDGVIFRDSSNAEKMRIDTTSGNVGIGTVNPTEAKLVVRGHVKRELTFRHYGKGSYGDKYTQTQPYSIYCSHRIAADAFNAHSDGRTKKVIGKSNSRCDLDLLNDLQVTDYTFVDVVEKGNRAQKKLIAQQVHEVCPVAVSAITDFIPSVYQMSQSTVYNAERKHLTITTENAHGFTVGETVRLIDEKGNLEIEVLTVVDEHTFTVARDSAQEKVFIYGKRVDDFLILDYDAITALNVSATQEMAKRIEAQQTRIEKLESENEALKKRVIQVESALQNLEDLAGLQKNIADNGNGKNPTLDSVLK